ncbi:MAG TPA: hypothetical protein VNO22_01785 [Planctomycetota bacterium]|nr:hypothetical protein [Planctomycetota bacterium]
MRKADIDKFASRRPFVPFEVRLVDGRRYRFTEVERFMVGRTTIVSMDRRGEVRFISIGLITEIGPLSHGGKRRPRRAAEGS